MENVIKFLAGKTVAVVGNAQSIFTKTDGAAIDAHDVVIRFNRGFVSDQLAQGVRTDILIVACDLTPEELLRFGAKYVINRSSKTKCGDYTFTDTMRRRYRKKYDAYPSTGMMAIEFCREAKAAKIDLFGFDFEKTPTFYNPAGYKTKHDYFKEEQLARVLAGLGVLTIN